MLEFYLELILQVHHGILLEVMVFIIQLYQLTDMGYKPESSTELKEEHSVILLLHHIDHGGQLQFSGNNQDLLELTVE